MCENISCRIPFGNCDNIMESESFLITSIIHKHKSLWILLSPFLARAVSQVKIRAMNILIFIFLSRQKIQEGMAAGTLVFSLLSFVHEYSSDLLV